MKSHGRQAGAEPPATRPVIPDKRAEGAEIAVIAAAPGFNLPTQARSRKTTLAILAAAIRLLQDQAYANLRMQDIADEAGCAVTAIYSRFADKTALLRAIHLLLLQECRPILDREVRAERFRTSGLEGLARAFVDVNEFYFSQNFYFVQAAVRDDSSDVYGVTASIMDDYARRFATVAAEILEADADELMPTLRFAMHTLLAIYRDSVAGSPHFQKPSPETLTRLFVAMVQMRLCDDIAPAQAAGGKARSSGP